MSEHAKYQLEKHPQYGFFQIKPTPSQEEISRFYAEEFYSGDYKRFNDSAIENQLQDKEFNEGRFSDICGNLKKVLGKESLAGLTLLDVGCGWGQALYYFQKQGMKCFGFDPAPEAVKYAKEIGGEVVVAGMDKVDVFEGRRFDVVTMLNVLEHLSDPFLVLTEVYQKVLNPGGILIVDVPNEFNDFQVAAKDTHSLDEWWVAPPGHLNYFNSDSLARLMQGVGFNVELAEASFPMEIFLLFNENYVGKQDLGKSCHQKRVAFEANLRKTGKTEALHNFYKALAKLNLGRQIVMYGRK
ncbi:MAG TPA: class I SAM-dependent methyltransferase [Candidatus Omnitrophota bacterium]|nr:class I SAM-dependent methyltransferase [Candidatus Omnitrophota bacterium]